MVAVVAAAVVAVVAAVAAVAVVAAAQAASARLAFRQRRAHIGRVTCAINVGSNDKDSAYEWKR